VNNILIHQRFYRQEINNSHRNPDASQQNPQKIAETRPDYGDPGFKRVGIDYRGHGIGGIVETIHKLESTGGKKAEHQKDRVGKI
jgi:hypothetical protein